MPEKIDIQMRDFPSFGFSLVSGPRSSFKKFEQLVRMKLNPNPPRSPFVKGGISSKTLKPLFGKEGNGEIYSANFRVTTPRP